MAAQGPSSLGISALPKEKSFKPVSLASPRIIPVLGKWNFWGGGFRKTWLEITPCLSLHCCSVDQFRILTNKPFLLPSGYVNATPLLHLADLQMCFEGNCTASGRFRVCPEVGTCTLFNTDVKMASCPSDGFSARLLTQWSWTRAKMERKEPV